MFNTCHKWNLITKTETSVNMVHKRQFDNPYWDGSQEHEVQFLAQRQSSSMIPNKPLEILHPVSHLWNRDSIFITDKALTITFLNHKKNPKKHIVKHHFTRPIKTLLAYAFRVQGPIYVHFSLYRGWWNQCSFICREGL